MTQGFTQLLKNIEQLTIDSSLKFNLTNMKYHDEVIKKAFGKLLEKGLSTFTIEKE